MRFINVSVAVFASLLSLVAAKDEIRLPNSFIAPQPGEVITAGTEYTVKWIADTKGKVRLILRKGPSGDLDTLGELAEIENKGTYLWAVDKSLESGKDYALQIIDSSNEDEFNYTSQFEIVSDVPASDKDDDDKDDDDKPQSSGTKTSSATATASAEEEEATTLATVTRSSSATETETGSPTETADEEESSETGEPEETPEESDGAAGALAVKGMGVVAGVMALAFFA